MVAFWHNTTAKIRRIWRLVLLFCVLRFALGVAALLIFERDAVAFGPVLTILVVAALAIYVGVALAVRRYSPARRPSA